MKRTKASRLKVVLIIVVLLVIAAVVGYFIWKHHQIDTTEGISKLKEMNKADVQEIDADILELEKEEKKSDAAWLNRTNDEKFAGCMVLGDSISQGLFEYNVLAEEFVAAEKGVGVHEPDSAELKVLLDKVIAAKPQKLFIAFGMNDIGYVGGAETFKENYLIVLERIQKELPETQIFINSILPGNEKAISRQSAYADVPEYNVKLSEIASEKGLIYIDNTSLIQPEFYAKDGVHMTTDYYPLWVSHMAEVGEL